MENVFEPQNITIYFQLVLTEKHLSSFQHCDVLLYVLRNQFDLKKYLSYLIITFTEKCPKGFNKFWRYFSLTDAGSFRQHYFQFHEYCNSSKVHTSDFFKEEEQLRNIAKINGLILNKYQALHYEMCLTLMFQIISF